MIRLCSLGSGSSGNASFIGNGAAGLLLDAGFSGKELKARMAAAGIDAGQIAGIVLSHEHTDHCRGAGIMARSLGVPLFVNERTWGKVKHMAGKVADVVHVANGAEIEIGGLGVTPFSIPHDAADPSAFVFTAGGTRLTFITDTGYPTGLMAQKMKEADYLVLEANHDPDMLKAGPYPWELKQRIASRTGHLSNEDCRSLLADALHAKLQGVTFAHLSETNNNPDLVRLMGRQLLDGLRVPFEVATQSKPGPMICIE
ncbi:MAG: MBL fold metallo-hydrolase [Nitrospinae bacterium]|nr:MBL fold metallo-hydrolase [Nitrospinota bacterium]